MRRDRTAPPGQIHRFRIDSAVLKSNLLGDKAWSAVFDNSKIKRFVPGFAATIPFHLGARKTLAWFEEKKERQVIVPETNEAMDRYVREWKASGGSK